MGLFFKKKTEAKMDMPPPPPMEEEAGMQAAEEPSMEEELPELPPLGADTHIKSDLPEIMPVKEEEHSKKLEFPEIPEESEETYEELPPIEEEEQKPEAVKAAVQRVPIVQAGPKFLKISSFQQMMEQADAIKNSLKQMDNSIKDSESIKEEEEKELQKWRAQLEDVEKKLSYVDRIIFKGE